MTFWVAGAALAGTVGGSLLSAGASKDAAQTQLQGTQEATASQERMLERQIGLQEPWRQGGMLGLNALLQYAGLLPPGQSVGGAAAPAAAPAGGPVARSTAPAAAAAPAIGAPDGGGGMATIQLAAPLAGGIDLSGSGRYAPWLAGPAGAGAPAAAPGTTGTSTIPAPSIPPGQYGSLLRPFSMADYQADPGYQFRLSQGEQGLTRAAMATHSLNSGKYLKDAMAYNSGQASQEFGAAYGRYNTDQTNTFNRLASIAGLGQQATNQQTAAVGTAGQQIGSNILGGANALAAGQVGSANAINGGIGQGFSLYQTNRMLDIAQRNGGYGIPTYGPTYAPSPLGDWYSTSNA